MNEEEIEPHDAATRASLHQIAIALAHLWLTSAFLRTHRIPQSFSRYYIYGTTIDWGISLLEGEHKRIRVTIEIEDY